MKKIKAVSPYIFEDGINFKQKPFQTWKEEYGEDSIASSHYPPKFLHGLAFRARLPQLQIYKNEARLRFCQPYSLWFDTFPDYATHEVIPMLWDCWPEYWDNIYDWFDKCKPKSAIFTSSQVAEEMHKKYPNMNILAVTEGIDVKPYKIGGKLKDRKIDFLQYGRHLTRIVKYNEEGIVYVSGKKDDNKKKFTHDELYDALSNSKVVASFPMSMTIPTRAQGIETLTQRYWECMLSRCVMIGHAPKELTDLIGYNPVIEFDATDPDGQLRDVLAHIENYQSLVDRNREMALKYGDWRYSVARIMEWLKSNGYDI